MTTRHGFSSALRLLRQIPPFAPYSRSFSTTGKYLKEHSPKGNDLSSKEADYDYRKPCYAARRNFAAHIRHLMRSAPNALTVITSCPSPYLYRDNPSAASEHEHVEPAPQPKEEEDDTHQLSRISGCLVSSFNTVTLTPRPYVSFNIRLPSFTYSTIKAANGFTASGLKDARVADGFANRKFKRNDPHGPYGGSFLHGAVEADGRLKKGKGGTWWMRCRLSGGKCVEVGDHMVVVGKVLECGGYEGGEGTGLVYAEGEYRKVGEVVDVKGEGGGG